MATYHFFYSNSCTGTRGFTEPLARDTFSRVAAPRRTKAERFLASQGPEPQERRCSGPCGQTLPADAFARCKKLGRQRYCHVCQAAANRRFRARQRGEDSDPNPEVTARFEALAAKYRA